MTGRRITIGGIVYKVDEELGHGLHSTVYGGHDIRDGQPVAIKIVSFSPGFSGAQIDTESRRQSYWKEVEMLMQLQTLNPYVIRVFNYDHNDRVGMIVMERGETFRDRLVDYALAGTKMPTSSIQKFWSQMVAAIFYLHRIGIVHGDCKPENFIQIGKDGSSLRLIDMGISFQMPPNVTSRLHTAAGTPGKS
jgi:5'-AMP-activated protein kinase catalytic alpha subunit